MAVLTPGVFVCGLKNQITGLSLFQNAPIVFDTDLQALSLSLTPPPPPPSLISSPIPPRGVRDGRDSGMGDRQGYLSPRNQITKHLESPRPCVPSRRGGQKKPELSLISAVHIKCRQRHLPNQAFDIICHTLSPQRLLGTLPPSWLVTREARWQNKC